MINYRKVLISFLPFLITSCCKNSKKCPCSVPELVNSRIQKQVVWNKHTYQDPQVTEWVQAMLCDPLTVETAVQIALLNNPRIQAAFENIGISQADLIEAGLLSNPLFEGFVRYPDKKGFSVNTEISITQNFIDLFLIPLRTRIAAAELKRVQLETANTILDLSFEVEETYYELVASLKRQELLKMIIELSETANEIALAQRRVGNIPKIDLQRNTVQYLDKINESAEAEKDTIRLREKLNKLLGLNGCDIHWSVKGELDYLANHEPDLNCLEMTAFNERLDIQAGRWEIESLIRSIPTTQGWAYTELTAGVSSERDADRIRVTGPELSAKLPIFNFGQADRYRFQAQLRQAQARLAELELQAYAEVREARDILLVNREHVIRYAGQILPNQQDLFNSMQELYNVMGTGVFELIEAKQNQMQAYLNYQMALKDYWISRVKLDQAIGGKLYLLQSR